MSPEPMRSVEELRDAWRALREREPKIRTRNAAAELGVSEARLVATRVGVGDGTRRIRTDLDTLLPALAAVGPLMALTRNDLFVHEKVGVYGDVYVNPHVSSVVGDAIDLRIFPSRWVHGFAVETEGRRTRRRSLQFFDGRGVAVHKIFVTDDSDVDAWEAVVRDLLHPDQDPGVELEADPAADPDAGGETGEGRGGEPSDEEVDVAALEAGWREMKDTHDFFGLLREHEVDRTRALRLVSDELARPASREGVRRVLETASEEAIDLMVFVRSPGTIQIHHGPVHRIVDTPPWLNVLDGEFDLHVLEEGIGSTWVVRKPVETGWVTSVEAYDEEGGLCALFVGCRKEGEPEDPDWRELARGLP